MRGRGAKGGYEEGTREGPLMGSKGERNWWLWAGDFSSLGLSFHTLFLQSLTLSVLTIAGRRSSHRQMSAAAAEGYAGRSGASGLAELFA